MRPNLLRGTVLFLSLGAVAAAFWAIRRRKKEIDRNDQNPVAHAPPPHAQQPLHAEISQATVPVRRPPQNSNQSRRQGPGKVDLYGEEEGSLPTYDRASSWMANWPSNTPIHQYEVLACTSMEEMAKRFEAIQPDRFRYHPSNWAKFDDGTDNIELGGFTPNNLIRGRNVLFISDFHNNDTTLSQFHAYVVLLQSFIESLTILLPFYPAGTMERCTREGVIATANSLAQLFSGLPSCGKPIRLVIYDLHTLQNRFFWNKCATADLQSAVPLCKDVMFEASVSTVAFPDDGAAKRFGAAFEDFPQVVCAKKRDGDKRVVSIHVGDPHGQHVVIVDDLVRSGGTLQECAVALRKAGALSVSAFVTHAAFPNEVWRKFARGGVWEGSFDRFWVTNSCPIVVNAMPTDDVFKVLDLVPPTILCL